VAQLNWLLLKSRPPTMASAACCGFYGDERGLERRLRRFTAARLGGKTGRHSLLGKPLQLGVYARIDVEPAG
jgi:hypothetical protein